MTEGIIHLPLYLRCQSSIQIIQRLSAILPRYAGTGLGILTLTALDLMSATKFPTVSSGILGPN